MSPLPFDPEKGNVLTREERMAVLNDWGTKRAAEAAAEAAAELADEQPEVETSLDGIDVQAAARAGCSPADKLAKLFGDDWVVTQTIWLDVDGRAWCRLDADIYDGVLHYQARYRLGRKAVMEHKVGKKQTLVIDPETGEGKKVSLPVYGPEGGQNGWAPQWTRATLWCWGEHIDPHLTNTDDLEAGIP